MSEVIYHKMTPEEREQEIERLREKTMLDRASMMSYYMRLGFKMGYSRSYVKSNINQFKNFADIFEISEKDGAAEEKERILNKFREKGFTNTRILDLQNVQLDKETLDSFPHKITRYEGLRKIISIREKACLEAEKPIGHLKDDQWKMAFIDRFKESFEKEYISFFKECLEQGKVRGKAQVRACVTENMRRMGYFKEDIDALLED